MARRASGDQKEVKVNGRRVSVVKVDGLRGSRRASQREVSSIGPTKGRTEARVEGHGHLHQLIAERAFFLYERGGFQDGNDLEHWLEAERQVKSEQAA